MRVVHVVTAWPRFADDVITPWLVELLRRLRERGVEAEVLAPAYRGGPGGRDAPPAGRMAGGPTARDETARASPAQGSIPVHRFRYAPSCLERLTHDETVPDRLGRSPAWALLLPAYLAGGLLASRSVGRSRPDVVHVHWPMPHALFGAAMRAAAGGRTGLVCSYYSVELRWVERRLPALRPFLRWTARTADEVTAISTATADRVRTLSGRQARVIPFAAAVDPMEPADERRPLEGEELRLLFVGRLVERKGVEVLVRGLPRILAERRAHLTVVGEGAWEPRIREAVRQEGVEAHVRLTGRLCEEELRRAYARCDIFVLPAVVDRKGDTEGLGVVLLEALRFGRPVVASAVGGIPDIVVPGRSGWLVPPGDPAALAERILTVAGSPEEARRVAAGGRAWAAERFSWDRILDELVECYESARRGRSDVGGQG